MSKDLNRRDFLSTGIAGAAALGTLRVLGHPERALGANNRVRVAICGIHGRGNDQLENYAKIENAQIAALCGMLTQLVLI